MRNCLAISRQIREISLPESGRNCKLCPHRIPSINLHWDSCLSVTAATESRGSVATENVFMTPDLQILAKCPLFRHLRHCCSRTGYWSLLWYDNPDQLQVRTRTGELEGKLRLACDVSVITTNSAFTWREASESSFQRLLLHTDSYGRLKQQVLSCFGSYSNGSTDSLSNRFTAHSASKTSLMVWSV